MTSPVGDYLDKVLLSHCTDEKFQDLVRGFSCGPSLGELAGDTLWLQPFLGKRIRAGLMLR